jgi:hypothetical protein
MGFIGIFRSILRKETVGRSNLPGLVRDMRNDSVKYRKEMVHKDAPAVSKSVTKSEFAKSYRNLQISSVISTSYLCGLSAYMALRPELMLIVTGLAMGIVGALWHFSFVIRGYRAREVAGMWESRFDCLITSPSEVFDASISDPLVLFPMFKPLSFSSVKINKTRGV